MFWPWIFKIIVVICKFLTSASLIFLSLLTFSANAISLADNLLEHASKIGLADDPAWLALVHYRKDTIGNGYTSEADDPRFFLSKIGKQSPEDELYENIRAFFSVENEPRKKQCQFPARYYWIKHKLKPETFIDSSCEQTNKWLAELEPRSMTLIFPASYINSPSSMFGHTLLRVNLINEKSENPLTGYSISYAANVPPNEIGLLFAYRGFFGGYEGKFSIIPYYEKIKEYNEIENRDIWEYELNFTAEESKQILRHVWELKDIVFDYYFFTENCSYQLLTLLEIVRPELKLREQFNYKAIPADTVRSVVETGVIESTVYRPSGTTVLLSRNNELSEQEKIAVAQLITTEQDVTEVVSALSPQSKSRVLEYAYDYFRYKFSEASHLRDAKASRSYDLLMTRSQLKEPASWQPIIVPAVRDDQGHGTSRIALGLGRENDSDFVSLKVRPAYHDVLDPLPGYGFGAQINFLDLSVKYYQQTETLELDKITFINISSMTPSTDFISPMSWSADVFAEKKFIDNKNINVMALKLGGGKSYLLSDKNMISLLAEFGLESGNEFDKGYSAGVGLRAEWLIAGDDVTSRLRLAAMNYEEGETYEYSLAEWELAFHLKKNMDLRAKVKHDKTGTVRMHQYEVAIHWYY